MNRTKRILALLAGAIWLLAGPLSATEVTDVRMSDDGEKLRFIISTDEAPGQPTVFTTDQPPRIVLELPDSESSVRAGQVPVSIGPVRSYMALSSGGRTRLVVDLSRSVGYDVDVQGNEIVLSVDSGGSAGRASGAGSGNQYEIAGLDFRRGDEGESRVLVELDQPGVDISVDERASSLRVDLFDTELPEEMMQQLDVTDFATPVKTITPEVRGSNVRLNLDISGAYSHVAYQTDNRLVIEVTEPEMEPRMTRELEFFQDRDYEGERITLNFQDIPVRSVLSLIADISDLNIVVSDSVDGSLTLRLTNVPWDQALDIVLETRNLAMRESGNVRWVAPADEIAAREQQVLRARAERETLEPLRTVMIPVSYADAGALAELIRSSTAVGGDGGTGAGLLSERGSVTIDQRTNTLLVTDTTSQIDRVQDLVTELDRPVRQVLIESRIVIARSSFNYELGVRFGVSGSGSLDNNLVSIGGSAEATDQMSNVGLTRRQLLGQRPGRPTLLPGEDGGGISVPALGDRLNVNLPVANAAGAFGISFLASNYLLDLELSALEAQGEGEVISTPRVITANQNEAFIQQGVEIPFEEATTSGATNVEFKEAVLELRVTPLITPDNRVQLNLGIKQDTVGEIFQTGRGGSVPSIDTRELGTSVLVENGQTVVLGGIFQEERNYNTTKVPMLGDVPVLGTLFRRRATNDEKRELLIFITPNILDDQIRID
ncbi:MAG: type IV pilus secretin PilQ [Wenzhouxiangellaceae bacterium]|nr:type IV pilus secretin PilQ [Wenzhouxiangellaceae bacterium]MBS3823463.1 type IV pilus secretin PilQ [Wenzhouxiangellaceae bacterium]